MRRTLQDELAKFMFVSCSEWEALQSDSQLILDIENCQYLNWCIRETLRLWNVVAGGPVRELTDNLEYDGMYMLKGSWVILSYYTMFRERWIDKGDQFVPQRWSNDSPQLPDLMKLYMPFGVGLRACLGQNMAMFQLRMIAAHFFHFFEFELDQEPTFEYFITMKPDQMMMKVKERFPSSRDIPTHA